MLIKNKKVNAFVNNAYYRKVINVIKGFKSLIYIN